MQSRLLYVVGQLGTGGLERQLCYLFRAIDRERYKPSVVVWSFREEETYVAQLRNLGVPIHGLPVGASAIKKLDELRSLVRTLAPEVVHSYSFYTNFPTWWATLGTNAFAVGTVRSDFSRAKRESGQWLGKLSARWPRSQIFNNFAAADAARRAHGFFAPGEALVVRNGVDLERFRNVPLPATGPIRIIGVGSLRAVKRWDRLLVAGAELKRRGLDFVLQIVGDGALRDPLERQAQDLRLGDRVDFTGDREDIPQLLSGATFLAHTSDSEGCPNVVMEAMACGRAVVATDAGDAPFLIENGATGFVVPRGDDSMLVSRMITLMTDRELCRRMGKAGRLRAEKEFGIDRFVSETFAAYRIAGWRDGLS